MNNNKAILDALYPEVKLLDGHTRYLASEMLKEERDLGKFFGIGIFWKHTTKVMDDVNFIGNDFLDVDWSKVTSLNISVRMERHK